MSFKLYPARSLVVSEHHPSRGSGRGLPVLFILLFVLLCWVAPVLGSDGHNRLPSGSMPSALIQSAYLKASNTDGGDKFGNSIAVDGQTILVGAEWEDSAAIGIDGDGSDNTASNAGAAYLFGRDGDGSWLPQAYLKASNTDSGDRFGFAVALSGDLAAVGAMSEDSGSAGVSGDQSDNSLDFSGAVYVFARDPTGQWMQESYLKASNPDESDQFGATLAMSGDTLVVGVRLEDSGAAGVGADQADNSTRDAGAVYVLVRDDEESWTQQAYIKASNPDEFDYFGGAVAIDGDTLVVGARLEDSNATGIGGDQSNNSASGAGAAYVFVRDAQGEWTQQAYLKASNTDPGDNFGRSVALSGDTIAIGASTESSAASGVNGDQSDNSLEWAGAVYVFERDASQTWSQTAYLKASNPDTRDYFGYSIGLFGPALIVGAWEEDSASTGLDGDQDNNSAASSGASYVFARGPGGGWGQRAYLKASNADAGDWLGEQVAVSGSTFVVAAENESSSATGVNGDPDNNDAGGSGAAYVFTLQDRELSVARSGQGQISSDPAGIDCPATCQADFPFDIPIELTASPAPGWRFDQWSGDCSGDGICEVLSDQDRQVSASFIRQRNLQVTVNGSGRVLSDPTGIDCDAVCQAAFDEGTIVTLSAEAEPGWELITWGGAAAGCGAASACAVTLDQNQIVGTLFEAIQDGVFRDRFELESDAKQ